MAPNKTRNAGRQLLILKNRMKTIENSSKIPSMRRREAVLLLELGQRDQAVAVAASLAEADDDRGSGLAFLADILASCGRWAAAREKFTAAAEMCAEKGRKEKAFSLAAGPLFLLAEAVKDYETCLLVAPLPLLKSRALRLKGLEPEKTPQPGNSPWRELWALEEVHVSGKVSLLDGILDNWKSGEAEWRWRILFEGAFLEFKSGTVSKQWGVYLRETGKRVLDPRYPGERSALKKMLHGHFVKNCPW